MADRGKSLSGEVEALDRAASLHASTELTRLMQAEHLVGDLLQIDYEECEIVVHDHLRQKVGGLPLGCFLLATRCKPGEELDSLEEDTSLILLRVELTPLGWIYGKTKLSPARPELVLFRLGQVAEAASAFAKDADKLPEFFQICFCSRVRSFLVAARHMLDWRGSRVDRTLMAFILVYLHGKISDGRPQALSNQMRQTKAMAPDYSIAWWKQNGFEAPPEVEGTHPVRDGAQWKGKFEGQAAYREMLGASFAAARRMMREDSVVYVRTDARSMTLEATKDALLEAFPEWTLKLHSAPFLGRTQTQLFGDKSLKPGEVDLVLRRSP